jgi:hypothetical protein
MPKRTRARSAFRQTKRKRTRKTKRISRSMVSVNMHNFTRWGTPVEALIDETSSAYSIVNGGGNLLINASVNEARCGVRFSFADMQNSAEFAALYDQYKIKAILFTIKMINNPDAQNAVGNATNASSNNFYPTLWYCKDQDDGDAPTIAELRQMSRTKHVVLQPNREIRIMIRPTVLTTLFAGISSGYGLATAWVDMARTDVVHYGLRMAFDFEGLTTGAALTGQYQFRINSKYYFQCKNVR